MIKKLTLKDGVIQDKFIGDLPVKVTIVKPKGYHNARTLKKRKKTIGVTFHGTANNSTGAGDEMHGRYMQNIENDDSRWASWHITVDDNSCTQHLPLDEVSYHAGDGKNGKGNSQTISIEMAQNSDADYNKILENAQKIGVALLKTYPNIKIYKHQDWSGKYCPRKLLDMPNGWSNFVEGIYKLLRESNGEQKQLSATFIMGKIKLTAKQLKKYLVSKNKAPKLQGVSVLEFCKLWIEEGKKEGVRGDIAFCQACHETGFFKYGGVVIPTQNNFGGIGAVNGSKKGAGAVFKTPRLGVRASIQHLKAYGSKEPLVNACIDPRFHLVTRGCAPNFEDLGGKWAVPGFSSKKYNSLSEALENNDSYGDHIVKIYDEINKIKLVKDDDEKLKSDWEQEVEKAVKWAKKNKISDCTRLDDAVTRKETIVMLYRLNN